MVVATPAIITQIKVATTSPGMPPDPPAGQIHRSKKVTPIIRNPLPDVGASRGGYSCVVHAASRGPGRSCADDTFRSAFLPLVRVLLLEQAANSSGIYGVDTGRTD